MVNTKRAITTCFTLWATTVKIEINFFSIQGVAFIYIFSIQGVTLKTCCKKQRKNNLK